MERTTEIEIEMPKLKILSPGRAIRKYCLWCCDGQAYEVRFCPAEDCPLHVYRFSHGPKEKPERTRLESIRARCIDCSGGILRDVRYCWDTDCLLYSYRDGHNPSRKGIGNRQIRTVMPEKSNLRCDSESS